MSKITRIEDIYPLTIVAMSFGKYAIIKETCDIDCVYDLQEDEETNYDPDIYMQKNWESIQYAIGNTINEAFELYRTRYL